MGARLWLGFVARLLQPDVPASGADARVYAPAHQVKPLVGMAVCQGQAVELGDPGSVMSTGADNKTMPITPEYADGHERTFGDKPVQRGTWVMRCSGCDGVAFPEEAERLFAPCPRCGERTYSLVDASTAPPLDSPRAVSAPIMVDRFYEGLTVTTADEKGQPLKVDIGSRMKHREYLRRTGFTTADDYKESWKPEAMERRKRNEELADDKDRRETIGRKVYEIEERGGRKR